MLTKTFFTSFLLLLVLGGFSLANLFVLHPEDEKEYAYLENLKKNQQAIAPKQISQLRTKVTKELFLPKETERMEVKIISEGSILELQKEARKWRLKEKLEKLTFYSQDKLYQKEEGVWFQKVKKVEAPEGWYNFSEQTFTAQKATIQLFDIPGRSLPENYEEKSPFSGAAKEVFLSWKTKLPYFYATHIKAFLSP